MTTCLIVIMTQCSCCWRGLAIYLGTTCCYRYSESSREAEEWLQHHFLSAKLITTLKECCFCSMFAAKHKFLPSVEQEWNLFPEKGN